MEKIIKYNVSLVNNSCIFDSADGFDTVDEALEWASGRGGTYRAELTKEVNGVEQYPDLNLGATDHGRKTTWSIQDIHGWISVTKEQIADMIR